MLAEGIGIIRCTFCQIHLELKLLAQFFTSLDLLSLSPLFLPNALRSGENFFNLSERRE